MGKIPKILDDDKSGDNLRRVLGKNKKMGRRMSGKNKKMGRRMSGRPKRAPVINSVTTYLKTYCHKFESWENYITAETILQTGGILTLEFVARAFDDTNLKAMFGPSLALFYALTDAFIESETNGGVKQWSSAFLKGEQKTDETSFMHSLVIKSFREKFEFRSEGNECNWGVISKNGVNRRVAQLFKSNITARFLVKLFDAREGIESAKLRTKKLGPVLAKMGGRLQGDKRWYKVFNQRLVLPKSLKDRGYEGTICAEAISESAKGEEVETDNDEDEAEAAAVHELVADVSNVSVYSENNNEKQEYIRETVDMGQILKRIEDCKEKLINIKRSLTMQIDNIEELEEEIRASEKATNT